MFTLISIVVSAIASNILPLINLWRNKIELEYKLKAKMAEIELAKELGRNELAVADIMANLREGESLRHHDSSLDGGWFINAVRASVRPVITYSFFIMFVVIKLTVVYQFLYVEGLDFFVVMNAVWDEATQVIFAAIMGFWFGSRLIEKYYYPYHNNA